MSADTILFIILASVVAFVLAVFMYGYKSKYNRNLKWTFGILRFLTLFSILLLLINPKFKSETYTIEKPKLPVLVDNSISVKELNQDENALSVIDRLKSNNELNDKFDISYYSFGNELNSLDSVSFSEGNTNISKALKSTNEVFAGAIAPTVLVSDGNQTLGTSYEFLSTTLKNPIYPIVLGDSTKYTDLRIEQLNTNRYAFLKNQFPIEAILVYNGSGAVNSEFTIQNGNTTVYRRSISFSEIDNTETVSLTLPASSVGLQKYMARIEPLPDEKNTINNTKRFGVEVIDQATNVLLVSSMVHPDSGMLKKAIETNEQRKVTFAKPIEAVNMLQEYQLIILYQPDSSFRSVFTEIQKQKKNTLLITGTKTDWGFLNGVQNTFQKEITRQLEEVGGLLNVNYGTFALEDIGFQDFPPLPTTFGDLTITVPHEVVLTKQISGFSTENPMLATAEINGKRDAIWDVEELWKWRAQSYLQQNDFQEFDGFIGKLVQYLASNKRRSRLEVNNETFYYNNLPIRISAQYFDKNYVFDSRASLNILVVNQDTETRTVFPMLLRDNFYEVDINSLPAGTYNYTVSVAGENISRSGSFSILDFNVEQQFSNADITKLTQLAKNTQANAYFVNDVDALISSLMDDQRYQAIQKSEQNVVPLIDWKYLLALIVLCLTAEWSIRKYNGLI